MHLRFLLFMFFPVSLATNQIDCSCGDLNIAVSRTNSTIKFGPSHDAHPYCRNMLCEWTVTAPRGALLVLQHYDELRGCSNKKSLGDTLEIRDSNGKVIFTSDGCKNVIPFNIYSTGGGLTVTFKSSDLLPATTTDESTLSFEVIIVDSSDIKNTPRVLSDSNDFVILDCSELNRMYSSQTFQLGPRMTSNRLQMFALSYIFGTYRYSPFAFIDGKIDSTESVFDLTSTATYSENHQLQPFVSRTGMITIIQLTSLKLPAGLAKILIKVYDETRDCNEQQNLIMNYWMSPVSTTYTATSKNANQKHCGLTVFADYDNTGHGRMELTSSSLKGTNQSVKVFPGLDITKTPFYTFTTTTLPLWSNVHLFGHLFTILVPIGATYDFRSSLQFKNNYVNVSVGNPSGIFMTPFYPFGSNGTGPTHVQQVLVGRTDIDLCTEFQFELFVESFSPQSSLKVYESGLYTHPTLAYSFRSGNISFAADVLQSGKYSQYYLHVRRTVFGKGIFLALQHGFKFLHDEQHGLNVQWIAAYAETWMWLFRPAVVCFGSVYGDCSNDLLLKSKS